ncbi:hypothetical protein IQ268_14455 [Oculatella sp. LEGE 06141]|uniref:hypothetical protein n=1 Tax=Oculatella sp. LEGE 06141 TaxID=1828648 RepID=UPI00187EA373|nr:hypothetical protein [Oculatella sp. LEGE 06141]MBE9179768.1 hypothetical protein [Oculatella sp. LEGE 06141]
MSSGRYQSRVFNLVSRQLLHWREEAARTLRRAKLATVWGTQIVLYPVYALFQTARVTGRQFQQTIRRILPQLQAAKEGIQQEVDVPSRSHLAPTVDTPIHRALIAVQQFELPILVQSTQSASLPGTAAPKALPPSKPRRGILSLFQWRPAIAPTAPPQPDAVVPVPPVPTAIALTSTTALAERPAAALDRLAESAIAQSQSGLDTSSQGETVVRGAIVVRGIASLVEQRTLVLVTVENETLDILTPEQQQQLRQRMIWEVAHYSRYQRMLHAAQRTQPYPLPPPADHPHLLPPVRLFRRLMAWMQVSSVAVAINLFQESALVLYSPVPSPGSNASSESDSLSGLARFWLDPYPNIPRSPSPSSPAFSTWEDEVLWEQNDPKSSAIIPAPSGGSRLQRFVQAGRAVVRARRSAPALQYSPQPNHPPPGQPLLAYADPVQPTVPLSSELVPPASATTLASSQPGSSFTTPSSVDETPWIEIQATVVGYVKHPLEQVLEWLDVGMSWIEDHLARVLHWMRDRL